MSNPEYLIDNSIKKVREQRGVEIPAGMVAYWEMARILARSINESEFVDILERKRRKIMRLFAIDKEEWDGHQRY